MSRLSSRATIQIILLIGIAIFAMLTGWACGCGSGSDHNYGSGLANTRDEAGPDIGEVRRYHDFDQGAFDANTKDLQNFNNFLQQGHSGFGVLVPQAPGATQPGMLLAQSEPNILLFWIDNGEHFYTSVPLTTSQELADDLTGLIPPPPETRWQGLVPIPGQWMTEIPTQTAVMEKMWGSLYYGLDFQGTDLCNHCEVQLTTCSTAPTNGPQLFLLSAFGSDSVIANQDIACMQPIPTYILLSEEMTGAPVPGDVMASFGPFGGVVYTTTMQSSLNIHYSLRHTAHTTETLILEEIGSSRGWEYSWADLEGHPITSIQVRPIEDNIWANSTFFDNNLQVVATGLPTCVQMRDTIHLTATMVTTPTIQAFGSTIIDLLPDPDLCTTADLGIGMIANTSEITAGNWVTYTLTITNFETITQGAIITQTLAPIPAIEAVSIPADCTWYEVDVITCAGGDVPPGGTISLTIAIQTDMAFSGWMSSVAHVRPGADADLHFYDNTTGRLFVNVLGTTPPTTQIFLPFIQRR